MKQTSERLMPAFFILGLLVLWEGAVRIFGIPLYVLPSPVQVAETLVQELPGQALRPPGNGRRALAGVAISLVLALALGILMDCFPMIRQGLYPVLVVTLQTVPMIVLAPIFIIYMGFGAAPKILTVVLMCFFPVAVSFPMA